jgi:zinc transporter
VLDGSGGASELDWQGVESWQPDQGQLWVHLDPGQPMAMKWLRERSGLSSSVLAELLRDDLQPRIEELGNGTAVLSLRGLMPDISTASSVRTRLHVWIEPTRLVSLCGRALPGAEAARQSLASGHGPKDLSGLLVSMAAWLGTSLRQAATALEEPVANLEYTTQHGLDDTSTQLRELRGRVTALRRVLAPVKVLVDRTLALDDAWFVRDHGADWKRLSDQARDTDALLQSLYDRLAAVHDYVTERLSRQMNSVLYRLTVFSTILLPITAISGLLGMNVGVAGASYRFMGGSLAFVLVVAGLAVLAWFEYRFMRLRNLLPKMGKPPAASAQAWSR